MWKLSTWQGKAEFTPSLSYSEFKANLDYRDPVSKTNRVSYKP